MVALSSNREPGTNCIDDCELIEDPDNRHSEWASLQL
jgi:hypothetical protein